MDHYIIVIWREKVYIHLYIFIFYRWTDVNTHKIIKISNPTNLSTIMCVFLTTWLILDNGPNGPAS